MFEKTAAEQFGCTEIVFRDVEGFDLGAREERGQNGMSGDDVAEGFGCFDGLLDGFGEEALGFGAADLGHEDDGEFFGVDGAEGGGKVLAHPFGDDGEGGDGFGEGREGAAGGLNAGGEGFPLGLPGAGGAFVLLNHFG